MFVFLKFWVSWNITSSKRRRADSRDEDLTARKAGGTITVGQEERCRRVPLPETPPAESTTESTSA